MSIFSYALIGILINLMVIVGFVTWAIRIREEVGYTIYNKMREDSPRYSSWILLIWLIPYIGIYSLLKTMYRWHKIQADNLVERLDIFIHRPPGFISKYFLCKETVVQKGDV